MKKLRAIFSALTAAMLGISAVPGNAGAFWIGQGPWDLEGYSPVGDFSATCLPDHNELYIKNDETKFLAIRHDDDCIELTLKNSADEEKVRAAIDSLTAENGGRFVISGNAMSIYDADMLITASGGVTAQDARDLLEVIGAAAEVADMRLSADRITVNFADVPFTLTSYEAFQYIYSPTDEKYITVDTLPLLESYISGNEPDWTVVSEERSGETYIQVKYNSPDDNVPATEEKLALVQRIYEATGIKPDYLVQENLGERRGDEIDVLHSVAGDANADKATNMADVVAIMQSTADPDTHALTAQGRFNADVVGSDGVTNNDALAIQQYEAGIIDVL